MPYTSPPAAVTGTVVTISYTNIFRDNDDWFAGLFDRPTAVGQVLTQNTTTTGRWQTIDGVMIGNGAVSSRVLAPGAGTTAKFQTTAATAAKLTAAINLLLATQDMTTWVRKASETPIDWPRESYLDGMVPIGAGSSFSVTFGEANGFGSSWSHAHTVSDVSDNTPGTVGGLKNTVPAVSVGAQFHTHTLSGSTENLAWAIPLRAVVYVRKA